MSKRRGSARDRNQRRVRRRDIFVPRPFEGLVDEAEWVALRELVPAATAPLRLRPELVAEHAGDHGERPVTLATLLPMAWAAIARPDGAILVGLQRHVESGDPNRDVAAAILAALATPPGSPVPVPPEPDEGPRLADVIVDGELDVSVHGSFDFWLAGDTGPDATDQSVKASLERANESIYPTVRIAAARAAYWCRVPERAHVRWVLPEREDTALTALARLGAAGELKLGEDTKFAGMFRARSLLVPVWDLPREPDAGQWEEPLAAFAARYADALRVEGDLDPAARRARQGLVGRQLTLR
ncbi:MAG: topoisomerase II [Micromonosporaceae bacterium]|nr:topoisomerase II [Micromonosporaceae bacterium]